MWDESKEEFFSCSETKIELEHSLVSVSKWEAKWQKPFISKEPLSNSEMVDYIRFMSLSDDVDPEAFNRLTRENIRQISEYIDNPMTATTICDQKSGRRSNELVTSELIYYWMVALNIPFECQYWHLNRLLTLVRVCNIKNQDPKKMSKRDIYSSNAALNAARRKRMHTKG